MEDTQHSIYSECSLTDGIITFPSFHRMNNMLDTLKESYITNTELLSTSRRIEHYFDLDIHDKSRFNDSQIQVQNTLSCNLCCLL